MNAEVDFFTKVMMLWEAGNISKDKYLYMTQEELDLYDTTDRETITWALKLLVYKRMAESQVTIH